MRGRGREREKVRVRVRERESERELKMFYSESHISTDLGLFKQSAIIIFVVLEGE